MPGEKTGPGLSGPVAGAATPGTRWEYRALQSYHRVRRGMGLRTATRETAGLHTLFDKGRSAGLNDRSVLTVEIRRSGERCLRSQDSPSTRPAVSRGSGIWPSRTLKTWPPRSFAPSLVVFPPGLTTLDSSRRLDRRFKTGRWTTILSLPELLNHSTVAAGKPEKG